MSSFRYGYFSYCKIPAGGAGSILSAVNPVTAVVDESGFGHGDDIEFAIGTLVEVMARTWPGFNRPGGVGRIVQRHAAEGTYDVKLLLGGSDNGVKGRYIQKSDPAAGSGGSETGSRRKRRGQRGGSGASSQTVQSAVDPGFKRFRPDKAAGNLGQGRLRLPRV